MHYGLYLPNFGAFGDPNVIVSLAIDAEAARVAMTTAKRRALGAIIGRSAAPRKSRVLGATIAGTPTGDRGLGSA